VVDPINGVSMAKVKRIRLKNAGSFFEDLSNITVFQISIGTILAAD